MTPRRRLIGALAGICLALGALGQSATPTYYPDDPLLVDPETRDARGVHEREISDPYDFVENTFLKPGDRTSQRAVNVNTADEVPDSSWFTNRLGRRALTVDDYVRGPNVSGPPADGAWTVVSGKSDGITPGFTVRDRQNTLWFIKFDPPSNPEMATGAEVISTKLFWALGYHVPENYLAVLDPAQLVIGERATYRDTLGERRPLTRAVVDAFLAKGARRADGRFRVIASRALPGTPVGPFKYFGTRPDDPNDIFPHEHRRELRGLRAFAAWLNHDDSRSINSLDTVVETAGGRRVVRHHLIDFGSTLGSASVAAQKPRAGNEYIWEARPTLLTMLSFGFWVRPWIKVQYPAFPAVGRIEAAYFWPERWKPEYPNVAFDNARPDDLFWAARRIMAVPDDAIRAVVDTAEYSERGAANYLADVIIARRDKIGLQWLTGLNPLADFALDASGTLTFTNVAVDTRRAAAPEGYEIVWAAFDNATGRSTPVGSPVSVTAARAEAPAAVLGDDFVEAAVHTRHQAYAGWRRPVVVHFRREGQGWTVVGIRRDGLD
ncbi:MAG: hypothetical protein JNL48_07915 [Acidobacteria bacterium]|nr:hypothetical protein [Acidobacteriota bacterium]